MERNCGVLRLLTALCLLTCMVVCAQEEADAGTAAPDNNKTDDTFYFVSHTGAGDPFWGDVFNGAMLAAKEVGLNLKILSPETPADTERQLELLSLAITAGTKAIATTITDDKRFSAHLQKAKMLGIPVIAYNTLPTDCDATRNPHLAYIGMNNYLAGKAVGKKVLASGKVKKRLVLINFIPQHSGLRDRVRGIQDIFTKTSIPVDELKTTHDPATMTRQFTDYMGNHPETDGVICLGTTAIRVVARLIQEKSLNVYCAGFDTSRYATHYIKNGVMDFTIDQQPFMQGYLSVILMHLNDKYAMTPSDIDTGIAVFTVEDFKDDPEPHRKAPILFVSHAGAGDSFWRREIKGALDASRQSNIAFKYLAPENPNDHSRQYQLLVEALKTKPAAIGMTVPSSTLFSSVLKSMQKRGIMVVAVNSRPIDDDRVANPYQAYIGMDDYQAGRLAGKRVLKSGKVKHHLVVANHSFGHSGLEARVKGLRDVLEPTGIKVTNLDVTIEPQTIVSTLMSFMANHDDVDGLTSVGGPSVSAVGEVVTATPGRYYWCGFDLNPAAVRYIETGLLDFTIDQQPYMQAYLMVKVLMLGVRYNQIPPDIDTGGGIIDNSNVARVKALADKFIR